MLKSSGMAFDNRTRFLVQSVGNQCIAGYSGHCSQDAVAGTRMEWSSKHIPGTGGISLQMQFRRREQLISSAAAS